MRKSIVAVALILCVILAACGSKELSRSKAAKLIKERYYTPQAIESSMSIAQVNEMKGQVYGNRELGRGGILRKYESLGWINIVVGRCALMGCIADISLTPKGKEESKGWKKSGWGSAGGTWIIPTARKEFIEVTGITTSNPTISVAEFTWRWVLTDDGKQLGLTLPAPQRGSANFQLYDDGWRLIE
jgi:hypothetical protein